MPQGDHIRYATDTVVVGYASPQLMPKQTFSHGKRPFGMERKKPIAVAKEAYCCAKKRPIAVPKEENIRQPTDTVVLDYASPQLMPKFNRDLLMWQNRPIDMERDLFI